jgi:dihydrofolate reductase
MRPVGAHNNQTRRSRAWIQYHFAVLHGASPLRFRTVLMAVRKISIIAAMARNRIIGINNTLPWRIPEDLRRFKALTMGHHIIMGRKTFDSIGRPLPGRVTVVVTRSHGLHIPGCLIAHSLEDAIAACAEDEEVFIAGGGELYAQAMPLADILHITEIQQEMNGDTHFPEFDRGAWQEIARERRSQVEPQPLEYHFATYRRMV